MAYIEVDATGPNTSYDHVGPYHVPVGTQAAGGDRGLRSTAAVNR